MYVCVCVWVSEEERERERERACVWVCALARVCVYMCWIPHLFELPNRLFFLHSKHIHMLCMSTYSSYDQWNNVEFYSLIFQQCLPASISFFLPLTLNRIYLPTLFIVSCNIPNDCYFMEIVLLWVISNSLDFYGNSLMMDESFIFGVQYLTMNFLFISVNAASLFSTNK